MNAPNIVPADDEVARVRLGLMLRNLRRERKLSGLELGKLAHMSQPKISKIETGALRSLDERDVLAILEVLQPQPAIKQQLLVQFELTQTSPLSYRYIQHHGIGRKQHEIRMRERRAKLICVYECTVLPGLLQLADYTKAIFIRLGLRPEDIERGVRERILRQDILWQQGRSFRFVVGHAALYTAVAGSEVQIAQLDRIMRVARLPNVSIGIVPVDAGLPLTCGNPFTILDSMYVTAETVIAEQQSTDRAEIAEYIKLFGELERRAAFEDGASRIIVDAMERLGESSSQ